MSIDTDIKNLIKTLKNEGIGNYGFFFDLIKEKVIENELNEKFNVDCEDLSTLNFINKDHFYFSDKDEIKQVGQVKDYIAYIV